MTDKWTKGKTHRSTDGQTNRLNYRQKHDQQMDRWKDTKIDRWTNEQTTCLGLERCVNAMYPIKIPKFGENVGVFSIRIPLKKLSFQERCH